MWSASLTLNPNPSKTVRNGAKIWCAERILSKSTWEMRKRPQECCCGIKLLKINPAFKPRSIYYVLEDLLCLTLCCQRITHQQSCLPNSLLRGETWYPTAGCCKNELTESTLSILVSSPIISVNKLQAHAFGERISPSLSTNFDITSNDDGPERNRRSEFATKCLLYVDRSSDGGTKQSTFSGYAIGSDDTILSSNRIQCFSLPSRDGWCGRSRVKF